MSDWRQDGKRRLDEMTAGKRIKLKEGNNCLRVLPDKKDLNDDGTLKDPKDPIQHSPIREYYTHRDVGPDKAFDITCGIDAEGTGKCWLCNVQRPALEKAGKVDYAKALRRQPQYLVNASAYDADAKKFSMPKPWWISAGGKAPLAARVGTKLIGQRKDYLHPIKGHNLNVERVGTGQFSTTYPNVEGDENPTPVPKAVLAAVRDLDELVSPYSEEEQKKAFYGKPDDEDGGRRGGRSDNRSSRPTRREEPVEEPPADEYEQAETVEEPVDQELAVEEAPFEDVESGEETVVEYEAEVAEEATEIEDLPEPEIEEYEPEPPPPPRRPAPAPKPAPRPAPPKPAPLPAARVAPKPAPKPAPVAAGARRK